MIEVSYQNQMARLRFLNSEGNSFSVEEAVQLQKILLSSEFKKNARSLIFQSGSEKFFCTGGNLSQYSKMTKLQAIAANRKIRSALKLLADLPLPKLAVVEGTCLGGGMELLSCFDFVYATPAAVFGFWQRRIGLTFGWGGGDRWVQKIGVYPLLNKSLEAKTLSCYEAFSLGLIDNISGKTNIENEIKNWVESQNLLPKSPVPSFFQSLRKPKSGHQNIETSLFEKLWNNSEHSSILQKFKS